MSDTSEWTVKSSECLVCFEPFTENGPKKPLVLHCGHTLCEECVNYIRRDVGSYYVYDCPSCRAETRIAKSQNGGLPPKNFLVADMLGQYNTFISFQEKAKAEAASRIEYPSSFVSSKSSSPSLYQKKVSNFDLNTDTVIHARFMIRPNEVSKLGHDWIESLWFCPADLKMKAQIPVRMPKVYIPCWVFFVSTTVTGRVTPSGGSESEGRDLIISFHDELFFKCACEDENERKYFSKEFDSSWTLANASIHNVAITNPQADEASAMSAKDAMEKFDFLSSLASKSSVAKSSASFELIPPEAALRPYVNVEAVWRAFEPSLVKIFEKKGSAKLERKKKSGETIDSIHVGALRYNSTLMYMPVYDSTYKYNSGVYRISINGQNGKVCGDRPYDPFISTIKGIFGF